MEQATSANTIHKALEMIAQEYISCESRICDKDSDKRNLLQKIMAVFGVGDDRYQDSKYYDTTEEQEAAQDEYMKQLIDDILSKPEYSEEAWNNATTEERKDMLESLMGEVKGIYGVEINQDIKWTEKEPQNGSINVGSYCHDTQTISMNIYFIENPPNSYDAMAVISHELRHAYQHQAVDNPENFVVTQETIDIWETNFDHYISPGTDFDLYEQQPVEVDAREFQ